MEKAEILKNILEIIRAHLGKGYKVYLFGSWAEKKAREGSDFDIGILGDTRVPREKLLAIKREVEIIPTLRSVDIVDLHDVDESYRESVLSSAKELTYGGDFSFIS